MEATRETAPVTPASAHTAKWTQGPMSFDEDTGRIKARDGRFIAKLDMADVTREEADANGRFFAAAPAMYEALRACEERLTAWQAGGALQVETTLAAIQAARAALAAAEGVKP